PAEGEPRLPEAEDHLREGAVHRRDHLVGQRVGNEEERTARFQVVVLGERAVEVRELRRPERPLDLRRTGRGLVVETRMAAPAGIEVGVRDPVALFQRSPERVGLHPRAEPRHAARHLVAVDPAVLGQRELPDLERLARTEEDGGLAAAHRVAPLPTSKASWRARTASSVYLSSMTHEMAISEVEIIWMLMPSLARVVNIREATPAWL